MESANDSLFPHSMTVYLMMTGGDLTTHVVAAFKGKDLMPLGTSLRSFLFNPGSGTTMTGGGTQGLGKEKSHILVEENQEELRQGQEQSKVSPKFNKWMI